ncbi:MAG: hypothetical protein JXB39_12915 [Deltaproteobacteria bacterium]|nr:hypothetical protein [Deltaproteobacteria bacterium]
MSLDLALFALAIALAVAAVVVTRPRPPAFDPEHLFKTAQALLLRSEVEKRGGQAEDWARRVLSSVLFHPAGREGWAKIERPQTWTQLVPALPGERTLVEDLARLPPGLPRFERLFGGDAFSRDALLADPDRLGTAYDPTRWLGPTCNWDAVAAWTPAVIESLGVRLGHLRFVWIPGDADHAAAGRLAAAMGAALGQPGQVQVLPASFGQDADTLGQALRSALDHPARRVVPLALGDTGPTLLETLHRDPTLRDRTAAVLLHGCPLGGVPGESPEGLSPEERRRWNDTHLSQEGFDTELRRSVPWMVVPRLLPDSLPPGDGRIPWVHQRLDEPAVPPSGRRPVAVLDLGPIPSGDRAPPPDVLVRAFLVVLAAVLG